MIVNFVARQKMLGLTACQQLSGLGSHEVEDLIFLGGGRALTGTPLKVSIAAALDMLVRSTAVSFGIEVQAVTSWLPGLRSEALLQLGQDISNWTFEGAEEAGQQFWPMFYGGRDAVRTRIEGLLGCWSRDAKRELRFYSQNDVQFLSNAQCGQGHDDRVPRFIIDAHALANRVQSTCASPLFTASARN